MESKLVEMEKRIKKMQRRGGEVGVARDENIEEIVGKVAELVKKNKGKEVICGYEMWREKQKTK